MDGLGDLLMWLVEHWFMLAFAAVIWFLTVRENH